VARTLAHRRVLAILSVALTAGIATACTPAPQSSPTATPSAIASTPPPEPAAPALVPEGSAADNLPYFTDIVRSVWAGPEQVAGRAYVDALTAAGFDKAAMQVTPDLTTVGNAAESIQFSVRWGEECLIGQVGPATGEPVTTVLPGLQSGGCLVGNTRPIDW
jgi:hypothetical protein